MGDWPAQVEEPHRVTVQSISQESVVDAINQGLTLASSVWGAANRAMFIPFVIQAPFLVDRLFLINGSAVSGNLDLGIYDINGIRMVSSGSTAQASVSAIQFVNVADTTLLPGVYYFAIVLDNITGTTLNASTVNTARLRAMGVLSMASAFPLPATATFAIAADTFLPSMGMTSRSV